MSWLKRLALVASIVFLTGCLSVPDGVSPVTNFEASRYLGQWYEIARLDHSFERGLNNVTANYSLREDGGVKVINRGFSVEDQEWRQAEGKAYFVDDETTGHLKVSFFGPFYGAYVVFELDQQDYSYAFVSGPTTDYLWLLSRTPEVEPALLERFKQRAVEAGFDLSELVIVTHDQ